MAIEPHLENQTYWQEHGLEYLRYKYKLSADDMVVDLGAYRGDFAEQIHREHGCRVICVEPTDSIFRLQHEEWCMIINKVAGCHAGIVRFGGAFYYSSLFEGGQYGFRDYEQFDVLEIMSQPIALLKINVEGMEYDLMERILASGMQSNVRNFQIQFHIINGEDSEARYQAIAKKLNKTHQPDWVHKFVWESWSIRPSV